MSNVPTLPTAGNPNPCAALAAELRELARDVVGIGRYDVAAGLHIRAARLDAGATLGDLAASGDRSAQAVLAYRGRAAPR